MDLNWKWRKKEKVIDYDNMYNKDFYFCLDFKNVWKLARDYGLILPEYSLAQINGIMFRIKGNCVDVFYVPKYFKIIIKIKMNWKKYIWLYISKNTKNKKWF